MKLKYLWFLIAIMLIFTGCSSGEPKNTNESYPVSVAGIEFEKSPERVVVLSDSLADVILATSYEIKLYGRSSECTQHELKSLPEVGSKNTPDIEKIKALTPDLIMCDSELYDGFTQEMNKINAKVLVLPLAKTRTELENLYGNVGCIFGGGSKGLEKAAAAVKKILLSVDDITRQISNDENYITACYMFDNNDKVATGDTFAGKLFEFAGAVNVAEGNTGNLMTKEDLKIANPSFIFCATGCKDSILNTPEFAGIEAINSGKVFEIEESTMTRQGKTILTAVQTLAKVLHPEVVFN